MRTVLHLGFVFASSIGLTAQDNPFSPFDAEAFVGHAAELGATPEQIAAFRADAGDGAAAIGSDALLRQLSSGYDAAVTLAEDGDPRAALRLAEFLAGNEDPWLRAHARYHLGRVFLDGDDPERAVEIFTAFLREDRNRTALDGEVMYFFGHALGQVPEPLRAAGALAAFLRLFPDAPERYLASASQQLAELQAQTDSPLHQIADVMKLVERRIRKNDTGDETQEQQKAVMAKLEKIIEQVEQQEQQSQGSPSGLNVPNAPAGNSVAPPGATRIGNLDGKPSVVDRWGNLQDRDRAEIESDLQTKLPGHYRKMLEEYYRRLGTGDR